MKKSVVILVLASLLLVLAAGCAGVSKSDAPPQEVTGPYPMIVVDDDGRTVVIDTEPMRFVSLAPNLTEMLFALGLGDRVVGVSDFCNYPLQALEIEKIGNAFTPNVEKMIALAPDVVVSPRGSVLQEAVALLEQNGINVLVYDPKTIDEIEDVITRIAAMANVDVNGKNLVSGLQMQRKEFAARVAAAGQVSRPSAFILLDLDYLFTVGDGEYLSELIEAAGAVNAASGQGVGYLMLSEEVLFELDPDIIICTFSMSGQVLAKPAWKELSAVKNGRVFDVEDDLVSRPGPRVILGLEELYRAIHQ
ncbi:MAG: ABC transporter substrate-binding protein [Dethiobacter sp.]|jgi:iron complex transport system substrate-binding protein|nr:ABC transporter substrate-binding protein [Dethiobacter sp.]